MYEITIRFYEELNDFLRGYPKKQDIHYSFRGKRSIKDLIETFGVPHVEVDLILVNSLSVGFDYSVQDGDRISVYPMFELLNIKTLSELRDEPLRETSFILDVHLGKLAKYLRLMGFDVDYEKYRDDPELAEISMKEKRILLTRDRQLLMRKCVDRGMIIRNNKPLLQIVEVLDRLDLWNAVKPFDRCLQCNGLIEYIATESEAFAEIREKIPPKVYQWCDEYYRCRNCGSVYWKGSHYEKMIALIEKIESERKLKD